MSRNGKLLIAAVIVIAFAVAATLLGACATGPLQPQPCATWLHPDGVTWMEEDNEPVDDDPCDRLPDSKPSSKAPAVKPSPAKTTKPAVKPNPVRTTRR